MQLNKTIALFAILSISLLCFGCLSSGGTAPSASPTAMPSATASASPTPSATVLEVVAAENFWGSLVSQMCGIHCAVTSVVSDPNADPHQYEANPQDAKLVANADYVIVNGVGYDVWAQKLISAGSKPSLKVLAVQKLVGASDDSNPHLWYNPVYVNQTVAQMYSDLVSLDPADASYFTQQYSAMNDSLGQLDARMAEIKTQFNGTNVAATEDIFVPLANYLGLNLVSPPEFMQAVAEGNDPSVQSVQQFQGQLESGNVSVLVYNEQTVTPLTTQIKQIAAQNNVTITGVTETIQPPDVTFQVWMNGELLSLQNALNSKALGN